VFILLYISILSCRPSFPPLIISWDPRCVNKSNNIIKRDNIGGWGILRGEIINLAAICMTFQDATFHELFNFSILNACFDCVFKTSLLQVCKHFNITL